MKHILFLIFLFLFIVKASNAQQYQKLVSMGYGFGIPTDQLKNYSDGKGLNGVSFEGQFFISNNMSLGISMGWSSFSKKTKIDFQSDQSQHSSVRTRYFRTIPLLITTNFYLSKSDSKIRPYVGVGLGKYHIKIKEWTGIFSWPGNRNTFTVSGFRPEIGVLIPLFENKFGLKANINYNYLFYYPEENSFYNMNKIAYFEGGLGFYYLIK